ncbi:peptidoglycan editing factor PgeF [Ahniella affigens]|uniref:Purine nucleoside phosphorylase n=1 Tax=Ahniella affigens TaxID=2021234 RepID=A0A2P1PZ94_9GAMM|nr:peptidoglycan editing factor PgeF [Ahniella affigens]AVQ00160.1 peptidoglycan editing factor PgeF [Ahniella affigens]
MPGWLPASWPAPSNIHAGISLRTFAGVSVGPYASANMGLHVGDEPAAVLLNRERLAAALQLPSAPIWLRQVHGTAVVRIEATHAVSEAPEADAAITPTAGVVLAIQTADCLPILLCDRSGQTLGAVHAGWRGVALGAIEACVHAMGADPQDLLAWIGPGIGPDAFEVGADVRDAMLAASPNEIIAAHRAAFRPRAEHPGKWWCDLPQLAALRLRALGLSSIHIEPACTVTDSDRFYSHRRDRVTGRMVSLIWRDA